MSLSTPVLAALIKSNIEACYGAAIDDPKLLCFCTAVASAVVTHITSSAVVLPTAMLDSLSGPVTGTGTVT